MWVNSKTAAAALGVGYETLKKSVQRAQKKGQNFLPINETNMSYRSVIGIGGASGKVLELDVPDALLAAAGLLEGLLKEQENGHGAGAGSNTGVGYEARELVDGRASGGIQQGGFGGLCAEGNASTPIGGCGVADSGSLGLPNGYPGGGRVGLRTGEQANSNDGRFAGRYDGESVVAGGGVDGGVGGENRCERLGVARGDSPAGRGVGGVGGVVNGSVSLGVGGYAAGDRGADVVGQPTAIGALKGLVAAGLSAQQAQAVRAALDVPYGKKKMWHYADVATAYGVSTPTLLRWMGVAKKQAPTLVDAVTEVEGIRTESSAFSAGALEWCLAYKSNHKTAHVVDIYNALQKEATVRGWRVGSIKRLYAFFARPEVKTMLLAKLGGVRAIMNASVPSAQRRWDSWPALGMVVGDQIVSDFEVVNSETGEIVTPEFYVFADMRSRKILGMTMKLGKYNKYLIAEAFSMVCKIGLPMQVYTDNGKPELSKYFADVQAQIKGIDLLNGDTSELDYGHVRARVKNSRAKPIENIFNHVQRWVRVLTNGVGYHKRIDSDVGDMQAKALKKAIKTGKLLDDKQFFAVMLQAVERWNTHAFHVNDERKGKTPDDIFMDSLAQTGVVRVSDSALAFMLLPRLMRDVRQGCVVVEGRRYSHPKLSLWSVGKTRVEVRWDPMNIEQCYVLGVSDYKGEVLVCELLKAIDARDYEAVSAAIAEQTRRKNMIFDLWKKYESAYASVKSVTRLSGVEKVAKKVNEAKQADADLKDLLVKDLTKTVLKRKANGG